MRSELLELKKYGKPMLMCLGASDMWMCVIEMVVNAPGVQFEVKAKADDPEKAVQECLRLMREAIERIDGIKSTMRLIGGE